MSGASPGSLINYFFPSSNNNDAHSSHCLLPSRLAHHHATSHNYLLPPPSLSHRHHHPLPSPSPIRLLISPTVRPPPPSAEWLCMPCMMSYHDCAARTSLLLGPRKEKKETDDKKEKEEGEGGSSEVRGPTDRARFEDGCWLFSSRATAHSGQKMRRPTIIITTGGSESPDA